MGTEKNTKGFQLTELDPMKLEVHKLASINPMMADDQFKEFIPQFKDGFDRNISHIVLYKGKVVDGRHRLRACKELGINLWGRNLPGTMSNQEVEEFVEGTENRRHQTTTQRAIGAYKYYVANGTSQEYAATKKLSNRRNLTRAKNLHALIGDALLDELHNGGKLKIINPQSGLPMSTDALQTLVNYFKNRNNELVEDHRPSNVLTDSELQLAKTKVSELQLECSALVLKQIGTLLYEELKTLKLPEGL